MPIGAKDTTPPEWDVIGALIISQRLILIVTSAPVQFVVDDKAGPVIEVDVDAV